MGVGSDWRNIPVLLKGGKNLCSIIWFIVVRPVET